MHQVNDWRKLAHIIFLEGDTVTIRVLLALGSVGWTIGLWLPLETFDRSLYAGMNWPFVRIGLSGRVAEFTWGLIFLLHFIGVSWRLIDAVPRRGWAFAINSYGFFIWLVSTGLMASAFGEYAPHNAMNWVMVLASFGALCRHGLQREAHARISQ